MQLLLNSAKDSLAQFVTIIDSIELLPNEKRNDFYIDNTVGKHIRHVVDHYLAFFKSLDSGILNYNLRNRDSQIEKDSQLAKIKINEVISRLENISTKNTELNVISEIDSFALVDFTFKSNIPRELLYLVNHTIHHAAYVKLIADNANIKIDADIGVAPATATFRRQA